MLALGKLILVIAAFVTVVVIGQNCSRADFEQVAPDATASGKGAAVTTMEEEQAPAPESQAGGPPAVTPPASPTAAPPVTLALTNCGGMVIRDFALQIAQVEALEGPGKKVTAQPVLKTIHLADLAKGIAVSFPKDVEPDRLRLIFNPNGNTYTDVNGAVHELKIPSAAESGLKVSVQSSLKVLQAGKVYTLTGFDPQDMFKDNGQGCMLVPVWRDAECK